VLDVLFDYLFLELLINVTLFLVEQRMMARSANATVRDLHARIEPLKKVMALSQQISLSIFLRFKASLMMQSRVSFLNMGCRLTGIVLPARNAYLATLE
jgi:hypothetical protein